MEQRLPFTYNVHIIVLCLLTILFHYLLLLIDLQSRHNSIFSAVLCPLALTFITFLVIRKEFLVLVFLVSLVSFIPMSTMTGHEKAPAIKSPCVNFDMKKAHSVMGQNKDK